jgi:uncharacterized sulfatase
MTLVPGQKKPARRWADAERLGGPVSWMQRSKITGGFVQAAIAFIQKAEAENRPFYLNLWPDDLHSPFFPPVENWGEGKRALYLAVLEEMDRQLGVLFAYLRNHKQLRDNTLVLICSDNGHEPGAGRAAHLRGSKGQLYEGGIRSPLIVWGPGLLDPQAMGKRNRHSLLAAIDLVPSLVKLARAEPPAETTYDGEDLLPVLLGRSQASRQAAVFFSRPPHRKNYDHFKNLPDLAVRSGRWKLLCDRDGSRGELFDMIQDPGERENLAKLRADVAEELTKKATDWYRLLPAGGSGD